MILKKQSNSLYLSYTIILHLKCQNKLWKKIYEEAENDKEKLKILIEHSDYYIDPDVLLNNGTIEEFRECLTFAFQQHKIQLAILENAKLLSVNELILAREA